MLIRSLIVFLICAISVLAADPAVTVVSSFQTEDTLPESPLVKPVLPKSAVVQPLLEQPTPPPVSAPPPPTLSRDVLTNEGVVALADAGYSPNFIMAKIRLTSRTQFDTTVEGLTYLRRNAIPEDLVEFMIDPKKPAPAPTPAVSIVSKTKFKKVALRVPKPAAPTPLVYVYYSEPAVPSVVPAPGMSAAPMAVSSARNHFWWR